MSATHPAICGADLGPGYVCLRPARHDGDCEPTPDPVEKDTRGSAPHQGESTRAGRPASAVAAFLAGARNGRATTGGAR